MILLLRRAALRFAKPPAQFHPAFAILGDTRRLFLDAVLSAEPLDATGSVNQLLFAGEKRMAGGADFHMDIFRRRTGLNHVTAGACNRRGLVFGMNVIFHNRNLKLLLILTGTTGIHRIQERFIIS
jgi:hypothetical protein